jgi:hypothetical protein
MVATQAGEVMGEREQAIAEIRIVLERVARQKDTIFYSELTPEIKAMPLKPNSGLVGQLLDAVSQSTDAEVEVMLSAVVIHKGDDHLPGTGFFSLARSLGREVGDDDLSKVEFHARELMAVYDAFAS